LGHPVRSAANKATTTKTEQTLNTRTIAGINVHSKKAYTTKNNN